MTSASLFQVLDECALGDKPYRLTPARIDAAAALYKFIPDWDATDGALFILAKCVPGFDLPDVLLKAAAINQLYNTNLLSVWQAAQHIVQILASSPTRDEKLVEHLAAVQNKKYTSFASKFGHFFLDGSLPIYDSYAWDAMRWHVRPASAAFDNAHPYLSFTKIFNALRKRDDIGCSTRDLDRYLWLVGEYLWFLRYRSAGQVPTINSALRSLFESSDSDPTVKQLLQKMMPELHAEAGGPVEVRP